MAKWNLDDLKSDLKARKNVKGWILSQENVHRRERYFLMENGKAVATDQDREVHSQSVDLRLFVDIGKNGRQGETSKKLFKEQPLRAQLELALASALQTDHQAWELPTEIPQQLPVVKACDPKMAENLNGTMDEVSQEIFAAVQTPRKTQFNSAELFMSIHNRELHLSNGLIHRAQQSRMYVEAAYSFKKGDKADEYLHTAWTISPKDLNVRHLFQEASDRAELSLDVEKPQTGSYSVLLDAEVLATLFTGYVSHLQAAHEYLSLPHKKLGEDFIPGATGDLITLTLDPQLEYGAVTTALGDQGIPQTTLTLVEKNKVIASATDKQHGDYLGRRASTYRGNVVLSPGRLSYSQLVQGAPQVLEILQFSGLFVDNNSGTFSSEIRLARLHDGHTGKTRIVKGGSLSGSIPENFKHARFSLETQKRAIFDYGSAAGYFGPKFALISDVSIVG